MLLSILDIFLTIVTIPLAACAVYYMIMARSSKEDDIFEYNMYFPKACGCGLCTMIIIVIKILCKVV